MRRWILLEGSSHHSPVVSAAGLPQGDPAAPLIMNLLMLTCAVKVKTQCPHVFQVTYMDDRTLVGSSKEDIEEAEQLWEHEAVRFHLWENKDKTQRVDIGDPSAMEVLGCLVGWPSDKKIAKSKPAKRIHGAVLKYRRVGFLPILFQEKLKTANSIVGASMDFGWIRAFHLITC